jgi:hypothetical protein
VNFAIPAAFEEIDLMVRNIEHAALIVAGILLVWCAISEWRGA